MTMLEGNGRPSAHLVGEVGQYYKDFETGDIYECRSANKFSPLHGAPVGGYVWELRVKGEDVTDHGDFYGGSKYIPFAKNGNEIRCGITYAEAEQWCSNGTNRAVGSLNISEMDSSSGILKVATYYTNSITFGIALGSGSNAWLQFDFILSDGSTTKVRLYPDETVTAETVAPSAGGGTVTYYVNTDDEYIHHTVEGAYNSSENDRVTKNELVANLESNAVIMLGNAGLFSGAIECRSRTIPNAFDWSANPYVTVTVRYDGEPNFYRTAEYTPGPR